VKLNNLSNVLLIDKAIWNKKTQVQLSISKGLFGMASAIQRSGVKSIKTEAIPLDEVCSNIEKNIKIIKIDVEGSEYEVLMGAKITLQKTRLLAIELSKHQIHTLNYLKQLNFAYSRANMPNYILCKNIKLS